MAIFYRRLPQFDYIAPKTLDDALKALNTHKESSRLLAGGTDFIPQVKKREIKAPAYVIDLKGIEGLNKISYDAEGLHIGPLVTINSIAQSAKVRQHYPILVQTALNMASPQVRNRGTFAGNICSAVPSADSAPPLLALGASVKIGNTRTERIVPMENFFLGPRSTVLKPNEILLEITIPKPSTGSQGIYLKLSPRHSMDLAVVGVAAVGVCKNGICKDIKMALGAVAPTPMRALIAESVLQGKTITPGLINEVAKRAATECNPIDDHRASKEYRRDMVYVLTKRALNQILLPQEV